MVLVVVILYSIFTLIKISEENNEAKNETQVLSQGKLHPSQKSNISVENAELEMDKVIFKGKTDKNQSYNVTASKAIKRNNSIYFMDQVSTNIGLANGKDIFFTAKNGTYDEQKNYLLLEEDIIGSYLTFNIHASNLELFLPQQELHSKTPVVLNGNNIRIQGDSLLVKENIIIIEGNVKTSINTH